MNIRRSVSGVVVGDPWVAVWRSIWTSHQWIVSPVSPVSPVQGVPPHPIPVSPFTPKSRLFWPSRFLCLFVCFLSFRFLFYSACFSFPSWFNSFIYLCFSGWRGWFPYSFLSRALFYPVVSHFGYIDVGVERRFLLSILNRCCWSAIISPSELVPAPNGSAGSRDQLSESPPTAAFPVGWGVR